MGPRGEYLAGGLGERLAERPGAAFPPGVSLVGADHALRSMQVWMRVPAGAARPTCALFWTT